MEIINKITIYMVHASSGNPVITTLLVFFVYLAFDLLESTVEKMIWGERFEHWLDPIIIGVFIAWGSYSVYLCALYNSSKGS